MQNKDKGDGIEDSPLDMLLVILYEGASKEVVMPLSMDKQALPITTIKNHTKSYEYDPQVNENKTKNNDTEERTRTANKRVHHEKLCTFGLEQLLKNLKSLSKETINRALITR